MLFDRKNKLESAHPLLSELIKKVAKNHNILVVYTHRGREEQNDCYERGLSKLKWPKSKHNSLPSMAIDVAPCNGKGQIDWNDIVKFKLLGEHIKSVAKDMGIGIEWGGDWTKFKDYPHFQLTTLK